MSASGESISFEKDIKPAVSRTRPESMKQAFDLWSRDDVARSSDAILGRLRDGSMPCDGAWPDDQIAAFERWVDAGMPA
jgi:hypothetical protein